jgi:hypothetical protein
MIGPYRLGAAERLPDSLLQLLLGCISIAGKNLLGFTNGNLFYFSSGMPRRKRDDTADFTEDNARLRVLFEGEDIFDDN